MAPTKPNIRSSQDVPPSSGYPQIPFKKGIRERGPSGLAIWVAIIGCSIYGFYQLGMTNSKRRYLTAEQRELRMCIAPYQMVEEDREHRANIEQQLADEEKIMKHFPGWKVGKSVYNSKE